jgi:hypothetical protein
MKGRLLMAMLLTTTIIMISATTITMLQQQYPQTAQASPCNGDSGKEYCTGYHNGTIQAHRDYKTGDIWM